MRNGLEGWNRAGLGHDECQEQESSREWGQPRWKLCLHRCVAWYGGWRADLRQRNTGSSMGASGGAWGWGWCAARVWCVSEFWMYWTLSGALLDTPNRTALVQSGRNERLNEHLRHWVRVRGRSQAMILRWKKSDLLTEFMCVWKQRVKSSMIPKFWTLSDGKMEQPFTQRSRSPIFWSSTLGGTTRSSVSLLLSFKRLVVVQVLWSGQLTRECGADGESKGQFAGRSQKKS